MWGIPWRGKPIHAHLLPSWKYFRSFPTLFTLIFRFLLFLCSPSSLIFSHLYPRYPLKTLGAAELYASGISGLVAAIDISVVCFPSLWCPEGRKRERGRSKGRLSVYYLVCFYVNFNDPPFPGSPKSKSPLQKDLHTLNTRAQAGTRTSLTNGNYGRATMSTEKYLCLKYTAKDCPLAF